MAAPVRFGIVGMGGIGLHHAKIIASMPEATLTAFSSRDAGRRDAAAALYPQARAFADHAELIASKLCDAVLIATPHYQHVPITLEAFAAGLHVLAEKPLAVALTDAQRIVEESRRHPELLFGIVLNQRCVPAYRHIRQLITSGELGQITRYSWTATHWFRPNVYYTASPWRATWAGEGGGVLINQCHHNLDLLYWMTGMLPRKVTAVGFLGKQHPIETEDEVSAILEYESGLIGHFFASTGEAAGTNRLEIAGTRGKVIAENGELRLGRLAVDSRDFMKSSTEAFVGPEATWEMPKLEPGPVPEHRGILEDFARCVQRGGRSEELLAPAADDLAAMELSNAMLLAGVTRQAVELPMDAAAFDTFLSQKQRHAKA